MTVAVRPEILSSLGSVREDVQRQVAGLDRYRALKAIEQTIADFPALKDLTQSLSDIRDRVQRQLEDTREYRALRTIERIVPELTEVLVLLEQRSEGQSLQSESTVEETPPAAAVESSAVEIDETVTEVAVTPDDFISQPDSPQPAVMLEATTPSQESRQSATDPVVDPGDAPAPANDAGRSSPSAGSPPPTLSYGIAQFLNPDEPSTAPGSVEIREDGEGLAQFRTPQPSHEGRAA